MRRAARTLAVLLGGLSLAGGGTLAAAGVAWSAGRHHHGRGNRGQTTTTSTSPTTTTTPATGGSSQKSNSSSSSKSTQKSKSSSKSGSATTKPKPKPKPKPKVYLSAALLSAIVFPERVLELWTSPSKTLTASRVQVSEDGHPVSGASLTPLSQTPTGAFGVVVVMDDSSSLDAPSRGLELASAQTIAGQRKGSERFGLVTFGATPTVTLPLTGDSQLIDDALNNPSAVPAGSSLVSALALAYAQLQRAHVPVGTVVVLTTGKELASPAAEAAATQAGLRLGYRTFVSDVTASSAGGRSAAEVQQEKALGTQLTAPSALWSQVTDGYLVSYRSSARAKQSVTVAVQGNGLTGTPTMEYTAVAPGPAGPAGPSLAALSQYPQLSRYPSFATYAPTATPAPKTRPASSFWSSPLSLVLVSVACALLVAVALLLVVSGVRQSEVETRVSRFIPHEQVADESDSLVVATPDAPAILARRRWWPKYVLEVDVARFERSPVSLIRRMLGGSLLVGGILWLMLGSIAGMVLGLLLGPFVLWAVVRRGARKNRARFAEQLPSHLLDMAGAMRGGRSMAGAISAAVDGSDQPSLGEFERVVADDQLGRPLETSLHGVAERMHSEDMHQVALVAALHRRSGSSVAEALDHVAEGARDRLELVRELKSLTGQARLSSRILTGLPVLLVVVLNLIAPGYMAPLTHTVGGIVVIVISAFMIGTGWLIMKRIVNVEA